MLDLIAAALRSKGISFCRIDGQASMKQRKKALETFENDPDCNLMLASISAAGEGFDSIIIIMPARLLIISLELILQPRTLSILLNRTGTLWQKLRQSIVFIALDSHRTLR